MANTIGVYVRLDPSRVARLDSIVSGASVPTRRASVASMLLSAAIDAATPGSPSRPRAPAFSTEAADVAAGARLKSARSKAGLTLRALGLEIHLDNGQLSRMERGERPLDEKASAWLLAQEEGKP